MLDASSLVEMFHSRDQLPLGPHANRVLVHRLVHNHQRHKRWKSEILQGDADLGGALANEADVRRGDDDFVDAEGTLSRAVGPVAVRESGDRRQMIASNLEESQSAARPEGSNRVAPRAT
jgi:hypothetical protein